MKNKTNWKETATKTAQLAHEAYFETKFDGCKVSGFSDVYCLYDNNPCKDRVSRRDEQFREIKRRLKADGMEPLEYGEWPLTGRYEGYTCVLLFRASKKQLPIAKRIQQDVWVRIGWDADSESA